MPETYTIVMRGENFLLTRDQIEFDSPNYFTSCFLSEFTEAQTRNLTLSRDPDLFRIMIDHLSGYDVLPLHDSVIPKRMNSDAALRNLLADAQFYQLDSLIDQINRLGSREADQPEESKLTSPYVMITARLNKETHVKVDFGSVVSVSEDAAARIRQSHEIDAMIASGFGQLRSGIQEALEEDELPTSYLVEAAWGDASMGQLEFDSPNYFTSCFLGDFAESESRTLSLSRDPDLFKIVFDYLSGYEVLPLRESALPKRMSPHIALRNLLIDARFYLLDGLIDQISSATQETTPVISPLSSAYVVISQVRDYGSMEPVWTLPLPIPGDTAQEMKRTHGGFDEQMLRTWDSVKRDLDQSLQKAQLSTSYLFITKWERCEDWDIDLEEYLVREIYYVLKLVT
ncbi:hypothetical protein FRC07_011670 [Ceratobasidium sp. 392]|nr:hypothetical protein FRC07_011670 [Ceratobasidium sp. 392]